MMPELGLVLWRPFGPLAWCRRSQGPVPGQQQETAGNQAQAGRLNPLGELSRRRLVGVASRPVTPLRSGGSARGTQFPRNFSLTRASSEARWAPAPASWTSCPSVRRLWNRNWPRCANWTRRFCPTSKVRVPGLRRGLCWVARQGRLLDRELPARAHCAVWHLGSRVELSGPQWAWFPDTLSIQ